MGKVIDWPKPTSGVPETHGDYLSIIVGETIDGDPVVCIEQCETIGMTRHVDRIQLNLAQVGTLADELNLVCSMYAEKH